MKAALYARVSTDNQSVEAQEDKLIDWAKKQGLTSSDEVELFSETASSVKERPEFDELMGRLDEFDCVVVTKLDRFGRSLREMLSHVQRVNEETEGLVVIDDKFGIDTRGEQDMQSKIMTNFLSLFADLERRMIRQRMDEGFEQAKEEGRVGRPRKLSEQQIEHLRDRYEEGWSMKAIQSYAEGKYDVEISYGTIRNYLQGEEE